MNPAIRSGSRSRRGRTGGSEAAAADSRQSACALRVPLGGRLERFVVGRVHAQRGRSDVAGRDAVGVAAREPAAARRELLLEFLVLVVVRLGGTGGRRRRNVLVPLPAVVDLVVVLVS